MNTDTKLGFPAIFRTAVLGILVFGLSGTIIELLLLKHTDGFWQLVPIALMGLALLLIVWHALSSGSFALRFFQVLMVVFLLSGAVGTLQHYRGNIEYEAESNPSLSGRDLYWSALKGSNPTLAPGTMIQFGLLGLLFALQHPRLANKSQVGK